MDLLEISKSRGGNELWKKFWGGKRRVSGWEDWGKK
jgi:hypothetical protein